MGGGPGGSYGKSNSVLAGNILHLAKKYKLDSDGKFGHLSRYQVQVIFVDNPLNTAKEFFDYLSRGASVIKTLENKGLVAYFGDRSAVVFRPNSKSGGPAIDLNVRENGQSYRIHFEPKQEKGTN